MDDFRIQNNQRVQAILQEKEKIEASQKSQIDQIKSKVRI